jgi:adenine phosphoribosyltransferase
LTSRYSWQFKRGEGKMDDLKRIIRDVPDFPKKGILFKDITTLLGDAKSYQRMIDLLAHRYIGMKVDKVVGVEARGFIVGAALAYKLGAGVVLVRKPGKLPSQTVRKTYALEYGTDTLEIHTDAIKKGERILIADDLLATGGTMAAVVDMVTGMGGELVECCFMVELEALQGSTRLPAGKVYSLLKY